MKEEKKKHVKPDLAFRRAMEYRLGSAETTANENAILSAKHLWEVDITSLNSPLDRICEFYNDYPDEIKQFNDEPFKPLEMRDEAIRLFHELQKQAKEILAEISVGNIANMAMLVQLDFKLYLLLSFYTNRPVEYIDCINRNALDDVFGIDEDILAEYFIDRGRQTMFDRLKTFQF